MKILILYASTEGQTRKIVRHCADRLVDAGHLVEILAAGDAEAFDPARFGAVIVAGSVHAGRYQSDLVQTVKAAAAGLASLPTLFLSVSLAAAGDNKGDWAEIEACVARFREATGWTPGRVEHVAGAFRFTEYDFFKSWAMRWIASSKGVTVDPHTDTEYTDWDALDRLMADWAPAGTAA